MGLTPPAGVVGQACRIALSPCVVRVSYVPIFAPFARFGVRDASNIKNCTLRMCRMTSKRFSDAPKWSG